jgi:hypothetical protein
MYQAPRLHEPELLDASPNECDAAREIAAPLLTSDTTAITSIHNAIRYEFSLTELCAIGFTSADEFRSHLGHKDRYVVEGRYKFPCSDGT